MTPSNPADPRRAPVPDASQAGAGRASPYGYGPAMIQSRGPSAGCGGENGVQCLLSGIGMERDNTGREVKANSPKR